jgi:hypothetical protein
MKACIYINCPDRYVTGSTFDTFCPKCGKLLFDTTHEKVKKLIKVGWYKSIEVEK